MSDVIVKPETVNDPRLIMLASQMMSAGADIECPVTNHFGGGVYVREMFIPAGGVIIGKYHRFETMNILLKGTISVFGGDGVVRTLTAPLVFASPPGTKCGFAHTDVLFANVHPTEETNVEIIEKVFIDETKTITAEVEKVLKYMEALCLGEQ